MSTRLWLTLGRVPSLGVLQWRWPASHRITPAGFHDHWPGAKRWRSREANISRKQYLPEPFPLRQRRLHRRLQEEKIQRASKPMITCRATTRTNGGAARRTIRGMNVAGKRTRNSQIRREQRILYNGRMIISYAKGAFILTVLRMVHQGSMDPRFMDLT